MYEDITPELRNQITHRFKVIVSRNPEAQRITKLVRAGKATQKDISKYADIVGKAGSASMKQVLRLSALPDATMYGEIAEQTIAPAMEDMWGWVDTQAAKQLRSMDLKQGLNIGIKPGNPQKHIQRVVSMVAGQTSQEALDSALTDPVITAARKFYDDFMLDNAELRNSLGFQVTVHREYDDRGLRSGTPYAEPCQWCLDREGTFTIDEAYANGVFARHDGCGCMIEYITADKAQVQTNWKNNEWTDL